MEALFLKLDVVVLYPPFVEFKTPEEILPFIFYQDS